MHRINWTGICITSMLLLASCAGWGGNVKVDDKAWVTESGFPCPEPVQTQGGHSMQLNLYLPDDSVPPEILECFELVYGVDVVVNEFEDHEQMFTNLIASGKQYDLAIARDLYVPLLAEQDVLKELDQEWLPLLENIDPLYLGLDFDPSNQYSAPWRAGTSGIVVDTADVKDIPGSWADLWNKDYSGRIAFQNDLRITIGAVLLSLGYDVNTTDPGELAHAKDKLADFFLLATRVDSSNMSVALLDDEADLGIMLSNEAKFVQQKSPRFRYIFPSDGVIVWQDNWVLLEESANTDTAYAFLNYAMQADVSWLLLNDLRHINPNTASLEYAQAEQPKVYNTYINFPVSNPPLDVIKNGHRLMDVGKATPIYEDIWIKVIVGD